MYREVQKGFENSYSRTSSRIAYLLKGVVE
jgi:hypothetical protein